MIEAVWDFFQERHAWELSKGRDNQSLWPYRRSKGRH